MTSLSPQIGSISDNNNLGGWYSYRASKAATNQVIKTLNLELQRANTVNKGNNETENHKKANTNKSSNSAIAIALHPGTLIGTDLSKPYIDPQNDKGDAERKEKKKGVHSPEEGAEALMKVIKGLNNEMGGKFYAYDSELSVLSKESMPLIPFVLPDTEIPW